MTKFSTCVCGARFLSNGKTFCSNCVAIMLSEMSNAEVYDELTTRFGEDAGNHPAFPGGDHA